MLILFFDNLELSCLSTSGMKVRGAARLLPLVTHHKISFLMAPPAIFLNFHDVEIRTRANLECAGRFTAECHTSIIIPAGFINQRAVFIEDGYPVFRVIP